MEIHPPDLDADGLAAALDDLVAPAAAAGMTAHVSVDGVAGAPDRAVRLVWRVAQEAVRNAQRHSRGSLLDVVVERRDGRIVLVVRDDGVGIDGTHPTDGTHLGLRGLAGLARDEGGRLEVDLGAGARDHGDPGGGRMTPGTEIRVVVVDDHAVVRAGLAQLLCGAEDIDVVASASGGEEAVALAAQERPDVVVMDLQMPDVDGVEATRRIVAAGSAQVMVLTSFSDSERIEAALDAGAVGYLLKDSDPEDLLAGVRAVHRGESPLHPRAARQLLGARRASPAVSSSPPGSARCWDWSGRVWRTSRSRGGSASASGP